jgi:hypothetical protein
MINKKYKVKWTALIFLVLLGLPFIGAAQQHEGEFPFFRSFTDGNKEGITIVNTGFYKAELVSGLGLRLTNNQQGAGGVFYLPGHRFTTHEGFEIEFEYLMYGDQGTTDGISMFLVDAQDQYLDANFKQGYTGAGFCYTNSWAVYESSGRRLTGIKGGYLAVALDQGPFKTIRCEGEELRNGIPYGTVGVPARPITSSQNKDHDTRSNVTIRGAAGRGNSINFGTPYAATLTEGFWGYPVLITRHTGWSVDNGITDPSNLKNAAGYKLNPSDGTFVQHVTPRIDKAFNIAGYDASATPSKATYRKAIITLDPNTEGQGGYKITVTIQHGTDKTVVIKDFTYPATVTYMENALPEGLNGGWPTLYYTSKTMTYTVPTPEKLVIGFSGSTGNTKVTNVIRNLRITVFRAANTADDDLYLHRRGPATVRPFDNDLACRDEGGEVVTSKDNIDPGSLRFWTNESTCLGSNVFEHPVSGKGKWVYDPTVGEVMFFPVKGFKGNVSIMYDIKSKYAPYNGEQYRSSLATISITINDNQPVR